MLERFTKAHKKNLPRIGPDVLKQLTDYHWPGNVRELQNYAERAVILSEGGEELLFDDLFAAPTPLSSSASKSEASISNLLGTGDKFPTVEDMEKKLIELALQKTNGKRNEAAQILGINVRTLRNKLHSYGHADANDDTE